MKKVMIVFGIGLLLGVSACGEDDFRQLSLDSARDLVIGTWRYQDPQAGQVSFTFRTDSSLLIVSSSDSTQTIYWLSDPPEEYHQAKFSMIILASTDDYFYPLVYYLTHLTARQMKMSSQCASDVCIDELELTKPR